MSSEKLPYPFEPRSSQDLGGRRDGANVLKKALGHVRAIESCGSMILGRVEREWGPPEVDIALAGTKFPGWGLLAMQYHAELRWGDAKRMATRLKAELRGRSG